MAWLAKKAGLVFMWPTPFYWIANLGDERDPGCFLEGALVFSRFLVFFLFFLSLNLPLSQFLVAVVCCCMNRNISPCCRNQCVSSLLLFLTLWSRILSIVISHPLTPPSFQAPKAPFGWEFYFIYFITTIKILFYLFYYNSYLAKLLENCVVFGVSGLF